MSQDGTLSIFVGQAGVQIANSFWELLCAEHAIDKDGFGKEASQNSENKLSFFEVLENNRCVPRTMLVDLEPTVIDEVKHGSFRTLFDPDGLISGTEDSGGNFARGYCTVSRLIIQKISDQLRKIFENDTIINSLIVFRSLGGGTGSGLTSSIFDILVDLSKVVKIEIPIYPSPKISSSIVEPYNAVLSEHFCMEEVNLGLLFDNEAMYNICKNKLNIEYPTFNIINHIVSQTISCVTSNIRFRSALNCGLNVIQTNLVPYPRIHFPISNIAPIMNSDMIIHNRITVTDITNSLFESSHSLVSVNATKGRYMSCSLFYRGAISPSEVYRSLGYIRDNNEIQFVDWCPTGFKVSISYQNQFDISKGILAPSKKSVAMLTNNSAVSYAWNKVVAKYKLMYAKRVFMHWFIGEGLEEIEFNEAQLNIASLIQDYNEISKDVLMSTNTGLTNDNDDDLSDKISISLSKLQSPDIHNSPDQNNARQLKYGTMSVLNSKSAMVEPLQEKEIRNKMNNKPLKMTKTETKFSNDSFDSVRSASNPYSPDENYAQQLGYGSASALKAKSPIDEQFDEKRMQNEINDQMMKELEKKLSNDSFASLQTASNQYFPDEDYSPQLGYGTANVLKAKSPISEQFDEKRMDSLINDKVKKMKEIETKISNDSFASLQTAPSPNFQERNHDQLLEFRITKNHNTKSSIGEPLHEKGMHSTPIDQVTESKGKEPMSRDTFASFKTAYTNFSNVIGQESEIARQSRATNEYHSGSSCIINIAAREIELFDAVLMGMEHQRLSIEFNLEEHIVKEGPNSNVHTSQILFQAVEYKLAINDTGELDFFDHGVNKKLTNATLTEIHPFEVNSTLPYGILEHVNEAINTVKDYAQVDMISRRTSDILAQYINYRLLEISLEQSILYCKCLYRVDFMNLPSVSPNRNIDNLSLYKKKDFLSRRSLKERVGTMSPLPEIPVNPYGNYSSDLTEDTIMRQLEFLW